MTTTAQTYTVGEGAELITYDVHGDLSAGTPLFLFGSPMDAVGFGSLAERVTDRPVVTYDPRGSGRNPDGTSQVTPHEHAEDLHRVIEALGVRPVDCFGTSGGAVNLFALASTDPGDIARAVAHEPPTVAYLPDREVLEAITHDLRATYERDGQGLAMAKFIAMIMQQGEFPVDWLDRPAPDPAAFGLPTEDDGNRAIPLFRNSPSCQVWEPDLDALRALGDRLTIAYGADSHQEWPQRAALSLAEVLRVEPVAFPGSHNGFSGGEYGQPAGDPEGFAARLREVLG